MAQYHNNSDVEDAVTFARVYLLHTITLLHQFPSRSDKTAADASFRVPDAIHSIIYSYTYNNTRLIYVHMH